MRISASSVLVAHVARSCAFVAVLGVGYGIAADTKAPVESPQGYRFVVEADGRGKVAIRGLITVDGKDRVVERDGTPFEFRCEAGSVIAGYFEALDEGRSLQLEVFDPAYSRRRSALRVKGLSHIRFSWAQPGVGPRCADPGQGACPDTTPSVEEFKRRLESLRKAG